MWPGRVLLGWLFLVGLLSSGGALGQESIATHPDRDTPDWLAVGSHGMVASHSPYASQAGLEVLRAGGNAVDAAIATSLALGVTRPYSTGLGGGGFTMVRMASGEVYIVDCRERGPAAATPDMFVRARRHDPGYPPSEFGGLAVGVPGLLAGHGALHERLGRLAWKELTAPAAKLAEEGFPIDSSYLWGIRGAKKHIADHPALAPMTATLREQVLFGDRKPEAGMILRRPHLAKTLRAIGAGGWHYLYQGEPAEALAATVQAAGGIITAADLAAYRPAWREPIRLNYRDRFDILLMPPPSSGGVCIAETLNILEHWPLADIRRRDPGLAAHLLVEALRHAFADRSRWLGDADYAEVPVAKLIGEDYAAELAGRIREDAVCPPDACGQPLPDDHGTSHYVVADRWGNIVSATETINTTFGSLLMVESLGIVLNNEMDDFTAEPGKPNAFGLRQSDANLPAPGKRPLSSMSPTIVLENGRPILALGAAGGPRIITATLQVMLNVIEHGESLEDAMQAPRLHHQWLPDEVNTNDFPPGGEVVAGLKRRGHPISSDKEGAVVQALQIDGDQLIGASDPGKGGRPAGF